ncbi:ATP-binding cassette domain-containing protein [Streptomyces sp. NPDC008313]|uniref:ATP-binding cassette domain-containing protein n=1 Tax=Streptomyces sp. NPDC008313 TaxID=3364826 RepID=UPI0036E561BB
MGEACAVAVGAEGFGLRGPRGWAFRGVDVEAAPGSLVAVEGPSGSGRTCLLLALTGRMRPTEGRATVGGRELPRHMATVRGYSSLAHVPGVTELDPALTVGEHLLEQALLRRRFQGSLTESLRELARPRAERRARARQRAGAALTAAGLDPSTLPKGTRTAVRDLERLEALRLSVAMALVGGPRLLGVDDVDLKLSDAERAEAWALLRSLAASGITVVAVCSEAPGGDVTVVSTAPRNGNDAGPAHTPPVGPAEPAAAAADAEETVPPPAQDHGDQIDHADHADHADHDKETADALAETRRA